MLEKIKLWFLNKYLQSFIRTFGLYIGTILTAAGADPALIERFTGDFVSVLGLLLPYLIVQGLSLMNAKKKI